uniref:Replicase n=1 Tax=Barley aphid RNA virus 1 TaxID=2703490 RepID=A0A6F8QH51_9VIRU|nr:replicase [Barley aphid RNA virus 1]
MANVTHDVVNGIISSLSSVLSKTTANVEKELYAAAFKNSEVQNCVVSSLVSRAAHTRARTNVPSINIYQKLTSAQQLMLQNAYMMFSLDFSNSYDTSPHAFARASRKCERRFLLHTLKITSSSVPHGGYDVVLKDIGGKPILNINDGALYFHTCFPLLDNADDYRHSMYHHNLRTTNPHTLNPQQRKVYNKHLIQDKSVICHRKGQNCQVTAQSLMFLHSTYDMTPKDIAMCMHSASAIIATGCFIFNPDVLINEKGCIDELECYYEKFFDKKSERIMIRFWFENDYQDAYTHDYITYTSFLYTRRLQIHDASYFFQPMEVKNSVFFFTVTKSIYSTVPVSLTTTVMSVPSLKDKLVLYYYRWETLYASFTEERSLVPIRLIVPRRFFENLYSFAVTLPEGKFTVKNILTAAMTFNTREIINGMTVTDSYRLPTEDVCYVAHAVFFLVYVAQYEMSKTTAILLNQENAVREFRKRSLFMRFFSNFFSSYRPPSNAIHKNICDTEQCSDTLGLQSTISRIYDYIHKSSQPERTYSVFVSDYSCKFITIEQECGYLTSNNIIGSVNRGHFDHSPVELFDRETVLKAITQNLPVVESQSVSLSPFTIVSCTAELEIVENYSVGDCFYQSLIDSGAFNGTVAELKSQLLASTEISGFPEAVTQVIKSTTIPDCYATEDVMKLVSHFLNITICIHTEDHCAQYGVGDVYHFHVKNNHCQAMIDSFVPSPIFVYELYSGGATEPPTVTTFSEFYENYLKTYYKVAETTSRNQYKLKYSTARKTVDTFLPYVEKFFNDRTSLQLAEIFSTFFSGVNFDSAAMFSSDKGVSWFDNCLKSIKYGYILDDSPQPITSSVYYYPTSSWMNDFDAHDISSSLIRIHTTPVELTIFDLTFLQKYEISSYLDSDFDNFINTFSDCVQIAVETTTNGGTSVFLLPFFFSETLRQKLQYLTGFFSDIRILRLLSARFDGFDTVLICNNRGSYSTKTLTESYDNILDTMCTQFLHCTKIFSQHIHYARTPHEQSLEHPRNFSKYYANLVEPQLNIAPTVSKNKIFVTPIGNLYDSSTFKRQNLDLSPPLTTSENTIVEPRDHDTMDAIYSQIHPDCGSLSTGLDRCSNWDIPLGITTPEPIKLLEDTDRVLVSASPPDVESSGVSQEPVRNDDVPGFLRKAAEEYLDYLTATIDSDRSLVETFIERVINRAVFSNDAVTAFPSSFFLLSQDGGSISGEFHPFTHYYNSKMELVQYDCDGILDKPFSVTGLPPFVIVNEFCTYGYLQDERDRLRAHNLNLDDVIFGMLQAGPGTGKTTFIIDNHNICTSINPSTVILSTREGRDDFRNRVKKRYAINKVTLLSRYYRTAASYLLNHEKNIRTDTLFVDEALMHHAGALAYIVSLSGCSCVTFIGDKNQIPFVNRTPDFRCQYSTITDVIETTRTLNISFRCPLDVVYRIHDQYEDSLYAANTLLSTISYKKISSITDVPIHMDMQYLVFTQSEKALLAQMKIRVATVHEFQGKEADNVIIVRLNPYPQEEIFNNKTYVLVAITRHKKSCTYYTKVSSDLISKTIRVDRVLCHEIAPKTELMKQYRVLAGSIIDYTLKPVVMESYISIPNVHSHLATLSKFSRKNFYENSVHFTSKDCRCRSVHFKLPDLSINLKIFRNYFRNIDTCRLAVIFYKFHIIDNDEFCMISSDFLHFFFLKTLKSRGLFLSSDSYIGVHTNIFNNLTVNATFITQTHQIDRTHVSCDIPSVERPFVCSPSNEFLTCAQEILTERFGQTTFSNQEHDEFLVMTSDLNFGTGSYRFTKLPGMFKHKHYGTMQPALRTVVYNNRNLNYREILLALEKRNFSAPKLSGVVDYEQLSTHLVENMFDKCVDTEKFQFQLEVPIVYCQTTVNEWLAGQKPNVANLIVPDFPLHCDALDTYNFSIKRRPKPSLECDAASSYAALQTILYHSKSINAVFCSIFKQIKSKLLQSLKPNCLIYADMSPQQMADVLTANVPYGSPFSIFSGDDSIIFDGQSFTEIDISKYDKSQNLLALLVDIKLLRKFKVPEYFIDLWFNCHFLTHVYDRNIKLRARIPFQRKSGDASTFLFNTTFAMAVIANEIPLDSLHSYDLNSFRKKNISIFPLLYNLEVKIFSFKCAYFCSKFLFFSTYHQKYFFIPDPLKLLVKLGRTDLVNEQHVECYRISLADSVSVGYDDYTVSSLLSVAANERYSLTTFSPMFLAGLYDISNCKAKFSSLYYVDESHPVNKKITYFPSDYFLKD